MMIKIELTHGEAAAVAMLLRDAAQIAKQCGNETHSAIYARIGRRVSTAIRQSHDTISEAELV